MLEGKTLEGEILECLRRIEAAVAGDKYESLGIWTVGGGNGLYTMKSPVNTEAEWALYGVSATGACNILISSNPSPNPLAVSGSVNYGSGGNNESNALEGLFIAVSSAANASPITEAYWQPVGRGSAIYVNIAGLTAQAAFVMFEWRRLLNRTIPAPPRRPPVTHSLRQSTRAQRMLEAESPMTAGFQEGRYPLPGGDAFQHTVTPASLDPGAIERGVAKPPTQAELILAKLRGKSGVY